MLSSDMLLTHYDPKLPITVVADASNCGVVAVILHAFPDGSEKAIMHASKSLASAEQRYGQIEKEALALGQHRLPETLVSDNGSQFLSSCFQEFCRENTIPHVRSPPHNPQYNGQAERFVDTFKRALLKSRGEGTPFEALQRFLLVYRTTPNESVEDRKSPTEALMGRKLRTTNSAMCPAPMARSRPEVNTNPNQFQIGGSVFVYLDRHKNQLSLRHLLEPPASQSDLPLDILLDT
ncbi:hypothetical protein T265_05236 [Opisthorchis viverrini]|uniref:Integrase catalytic domain-containing protein n=1 Tax=Opisthorchis viverrini TaxID=6198 RepID=A0A074ZPS8_OPIVI|nr:hypothetical protein T265_05236 [Opisthorchis viverrini]KER27817.1 hypothetical protein T265_05236 [Opisthorchis viverrini]